MKKEILTDFIDNGTTTSTVGHVFKSDFQGNRGRDICLEMFGEQDEECRKYNNEKTN